MGGPGQSPDVTEIALIPTVKPVKWAKRWTDWLGPFAVRQGRVSMPPRADAFRFSR
jgi:hypothetical protein